MNSKLEYNQTDAEWYPSARVATTLGYKWAVPVIYTLDRKGEASFVELRDSIQISSKVLTDTLKTLNENGFVNRREEDGNRTYYSLNVDPEHLIIELEGLNDQL